MFDYFRLICKVTCQIGNWAISPIRFLLFDFIIFLNYFFFFFFACIIEKLKSLLGHKSLSTNLFSITITFIQSYLHIVYLIYVLYLSIIVWCSGSGIPMFIYKDSWLFFKFKFIAPMEILIHLFFIFFLISYNFFSNRFQYSNLFLFILNTIPPTSAHHYFLIIFLYPRINTNIF